MADSGAGSELAPSRYDLTGHGDWLPLPELLTSLANQADEGEERDTYGDGPLIEDFEREVAELLGMEAGVFLPTGIMAQQIALRIWSERSGRSSVVMHPTAHLEWAEHLGYEHLHGLARLQFGAPEWMRDRLFTADDLAAIATVPGSLLLELPHRPLGGQLLPWDELLRVRDWAADREVALHMDGARLWSCATWYGRPLAEIAALFDSVYVSFYKDLGGIAGAMLLGSAEFIAEARVWQVRHGGRPFTMAPYIVSARAGLRQRLPLMPSWVTRAREIAAIYASHPRVTVSPDPPQVNFFRVFVQGEADALNESADAYRTRTGFQILPHLRPSPVPGIASGELHCWENASAYPESELGVGLERLLG